MTPWIARCLRADLFGRCVRCGDPCGPEGCDVCRTDQSDAQEARRAAHEAAGRCRCGRARAEDRLQCRECIAWDYARERWKMPRVRDVEQGLMDGRQLSLFGAMATNQGETG